MEGNEIHPYYEILYYIGGDATFLSEKFQEDLLPGTLLLIPRATYHQFAIRSQNEYTRLVLNFPDIEDTKGLIGSAMTGIRIIRRPEGRMTDLLKQMCQVVCSESPETERSVFLYGAFLMLFAALKMEDVEITSPRLREEDRLISECICYIEQHFRSKISAEMIARQMNVSVSTLFHCFKKELGTSLYRYITEKRLIYAHKLISAGQKPTKVYLECGYSDYPTFYKAYRKMFGQPPSINIP